MMFYANNYFRIFFRFSVGGLIVRVGSSSSTDGGQVLTVNNTYYPAEYGETAWDWDVAVIKTNEPIKLGKNVKRIKLATKNLKGGSKGKIAGWGAVDEVTLAF